MYLSVHVSIDLCTNLFLYYVYLDLDMYMYLYTHRSTCMHSCIGAGAWKHASLVQTKYSITKRNRVDVSLCVVKCMDARTCVCVEVLAV